MIKSESDLPNPREKGMRPLLCLLSSIVYLYEVFGVVSVSQIK